MTDGPIDAVIAAAGSGTRLGRAEPKAFVEVAGVPMLRHSLDRVAEIGVRHAVVTVPADDVARWGDAVVELAPCPVHVVVGGATRQASVWEGVRMLGELAAGEEPTSVVLVHDAARPCATGELWRRVADAARADGAAIPVLPSTDTLKRLDERQHLHTIDREAIVRAQTPQGFRLDTLIEAHRAALTSGLEATDDAALMERLGHAVSAVPGEEGNIKVTGPEDLEVAARRLGEGAGAPVRVGYGYDIHPLIEGRRLVLGGVEIEHDRGLDGHSDADSLAHAVTDALLGAAGMGDIGLRFPADDERWKDADSLVLLGVVVGELADAGFRPLNVDATILAEAPRLSPHLDDMRARLAERLGLTPEAVNVKATRGEGLGAIGRGEGIAAHAVATVRPF